MTAHPRATVNGRAASGPPAASLRSDGLGPAPRSRRARGVFSREDDGVSPVVGMILVLGISVVGMAAILYWGLPAIDEMKANVEYQSVQSQFMEFDATVKELVTGTTEKTAKKWLPSLNRGSVSVQNATDMWLYAVETYNKDVDYDFVYWGFSDGDHNFSIASTVQINKPVIVKGYVLSGSSTQTAINISAPATTTGHQMASGDISTWDANDEIEFEAFSATDESITIPLSNRTFKFEVVVDNEVVAQAWYVTTGRIDFELNAGLGNKKVTINNGAVFTGDSSGVALISNPTLPPAPVTNGIERHFARAIPLHGNTSFGGQDRFDLLVSLDSTSTLADYDCANGDRSDCVESSKLFVFGDQQDEWYGYLKSTRRGYDYAETTFGTTTYLVDRENYMAYTLLQSIIKLT